MAYYNFCILTPDEVTAAYEILYNSDLISL